MKINITLLLVIMSYVAFAQSDFSREELRQGYERQYVSRAESPDMSIYDKVCGFASILPCDDDKDYHWYVKQSDVLRHVGKIIIPPSMYCVQNISYPAWGMERVEKNDTLALYWVGSLNHYLDKEDVKLRNKLKKKYGSVILEDSVEVIPAKWFSGELLVSRNPDWYGGFLTSSLQKSMQFRAGVSAPYTDVVERISAVGSLYYDYMGISKENPNIINTGDNPFKLEAKLQAHAMNLLARDLGRSFTTSYPQDSTRWNEYPILILTDSVHKSHIEALYPDSLDEKGKCLIQSLSDAMEQQPAGILTESRTIDGRVFNALFVRAIYNTVSKLWMFMEYPRVHFRPGDKVDWWNKGRRGYDNQGK